LLIVNLAFGLVARVSPQLNIFTVGFPAMLMAGLALLSLAAPAWVGALEQAMRVALLALR
jgi:flagellar biosynthetic protein FliR